jgi:hypothetical protein
MQRDRSMYSSSRRSASRSGKCRGAPSVGAHARSLVGMLLEQRPACPRSARAPSRSISVNGSAKVPGWENCKTLVSVVAYRPSMESGGFEHPNDTPPHPFMPYQLSSITDCPKARRARLRFRGGQPWRFRYSVPQSRSSASGLRSMDGGLNYTIAGCKLPR